MVASEPRLPAAHVPAQLLPPPPFEYELEGLRGFAAIAVAWCHYVQVVGRPTPQYIPYGVLAYQPPAHLSVLIFFVLSGYVIGLTTQTPFTLATTAVYWGKRLLRLYPIYFISVLAALAVAGAGYSGLVIVGNLLFSQILLVPLIAENAPAWSLHYELLYYLLFIPASLLRLNTLAVVAGSLVGGLLCFSWLPAHPLLASYALGFAFWACGLALATYVARLPRLPVSYTLLLATLLLLFSLRNFNYLEIIEQKALLGLLGHDWVYHIDPEAFTTTMRPHDLAYLPYAVGAILIFTHRAFPYRQLLLAALFLLPGLTLGSILYHWSTVEKTQYLVPAASYCAALALFFSKARGLERLGQRVMRGLIQAGGVSYGLYLIHYPLLQVFRRVSFFAGNELLYAGQFIVFALLAGTAAYGLEKKVQPALKQWLTRQQPEPLA